MSEKPLVLTPIGHLHARPDGFTLALLPSFRPALRGLSGFSHVQIFWWADQLDLPDLRAETTLQQPYRAGPAALGIFATRSPLRPNPLCLTTAPLLAVDEQKGLVRVAYHDAADGSPLLDLKPYTPSCDRVQNCASPEWCRHWPLWFEDSAAFDWPAEFGPAEA